jgi:uncharacterized protein (DUF488 family)
VAEGKRLIYTLGTSTRSPQEFLELLLGHSVGVVVDVRRFPTSRFEHFQGERLRGLLRQVGIDYIQMGRELGGHRPGGYQNFTATAEFQKGIGKLEEIASERATAIVCAERFPWRCHRRFIALALEARRWQVIHIIEPGRDWQPKDRTRYQ